MGEAAQIAERAMAVAYAAIEPGVRQCDVAAAIYAAQIGGTDSFGGDYPAFVPLLPTGIGTRRRTSPGPMSRSSPIRRPSSNWPAAAPATDCPMARTLFLGSPPPEILDTEQVVLGRLQAALDAASPGATCEEVEAAGGRSPSAAG
jgi:Xaa-Pro aminopeptidase